MKNCFKWIFDVALLVMIALAFIWPQSMALKAVALWAWFAIVVGLLLVAAAFVGQCTWWRAGKRGVSDLTRQAMGLDKDITMGKQFRFVVMLALISACLLSGGMEFTALSYMAALLGFRFLRSVLLMMLETKPCHASSV